MEILRLVLLFVHILGFAALLGGLVVAGARHATSRVNAAMRDGDRHGRSSPACSSSASSRPGTPPSTTPRSA